MIESGPRTDIPNAFKQKKGMGPNGNIPLASGLFKLALEIPVSHLKGDTKEINEIREAAKKIVKITKEMNKEDREAMSKTAKNNYIGNQCYCKKCNVKIVEGEICKECMKHESR